MTPSAYLRDRMSRMRREECVSLYSRCEGHDQGRATTANFEGRRVAPGPADEESQDLNGFSTFTEPYRWPSERSSE